MPPYPRMSFREYPRLFFRETETPESVYGLFYNSYPDIFEDIPIKQAIEYMKKFLILNYERLGNHRFAIKNVIFDNPNCYYFFEDLTMENYEKIQSRFGRNNEYGIIFG